MTRTKKASSKAQRLLLPARLQPKPQPVPPALADLPVQLEPCRKAIKALLAHLQARPQSSNLIQSEEWLELVVTTKRMSPRERHMPIRIPVPHPLLDPKKAGVCLFVKDPAAEYKKLLAEANVGFVSKVIGVEKLKGKYKPFEARRQLLDTYAVFLADDRIIPALPKLLGKQWLTRKRQPLPVSLKPKSVKANLEAALASTSLFIPNGTSLTVRLGSTDSHTPEQLLANLEAVLPHLAVRIPEGGWENVQALHLKTSTSAALPIWTADMPLVIPPAPTTLEEEGLDVLPDLEDADEEEIQQAITASQKGKPARPNKATMSGERKRISQGGTTKPAKQKRRKAA